MKKFILLIVIAALDFAAHAQSCDKKSCGPEGTKKEEAAVITTMRSDLQAVITKMSKSSLGFDSQFKGVKIEKGATDDESLLLLTQAASSIRHEFLSKVPSSSLLASLKEHKPSVLSTKQQMVSSLKTEIQILAAQAENL